MHKHDNWEGPIRGSNTWWRGMEPIASTEEQQAVKGNKQNDPNIRWDLVRRIRKEIADGKYDNEERWTAALDLMLDDLG